jgi:hypothetical protein
MFIVSCVYDFYSSIIETMTCGCCCARKRPKRPSFWEVATRPSNLIAIAATSVGAISLAKHWVGKVPHMPHVPEMGRVPMPGDPQSWEDRQIEKLKENGSKIWETFKQFQKNTREQSEYNDPGSFYYHNTFRQGDETFCVIQ